MTLAMKAQERPSDGVWCLHGFLTGLLASILSTLVGETTNAWAGVLILVLLIAVGVHDVYRRWGGL